MKKLYLLVVMCAFMFTFGTVAQAYAVPHYSVSYSKKMIKYAAKKVHASTRDVNDLFYMAFHESSYHSWSHSRSECHGLFQLSKGMAHGHSWWNPKWSTWRAIKYMKGRYGSIHKARLFWQRHHWY